MLLILHPARFMPPSAVALRGDRGLRRREASDRGAERGGANVVETNLVAEGDRLGIAAVLAADADLEIRASLATALDGNPHHRADALAVKHLEWVVRQNAVLDVVAEKLGLGIIPREAIDRLSQV